MEKEKLCCSTVYFQIMLQTTFICCFVAGFTCHDVLSSFTWKKKNYINNVSISVSLIINLSLLIHSEFPRMPLNNLRENIQFDVFFFFKHTILVVSSVYTNSKKYLLLFILLNKNWSQHFYNQSLRVILHNGECIKNSSSCDFKIVKSNLHYLYFLTVNIFSLINCIVFEPWHVCSVIKGKNNGVYGGIFPLRTGV